MKIPSISKDSRPHYEATMQRMLAFTEHGAPEAFKWLTWSIAIAGLEVVRRTTGADWLLIAEVVLALLVLGRIQWRLGVYERTEEVEFPDGSLQVKLSFKQFFMSLFCWALTLALTVGIAGVIADSELLTSAISAKP